MNPRYLIVNLSKINEYAALIEHLKLLMHVAENAGWSHRISAKNLSCIVIDLQDKFITGCNGTGILFTSALEVSYIEAIDRILEQKQVSNKFKEGDIVVFNKFPEGLSGGVSFVLNKPYILDNNNVLMFEFNDRGMRDGWRNFELSKAADCLRFATAEEITYKLYSYETPEMTIQFVKTEKAVKLLRAGLRTELFPYMTMEALLRIWEELRNTVSREHFKAIQFTDCSFRPIEFRNIDMIILKQIYTLFKQRYNIGN